MEVNNSLHKLHSSSSFKILNCSHGKFISDTNMSHEEGNHELVLAHFAGDNTNSLQ